jgi:subtilisin family serine protease
MNKFYGAVLTLWLLVAFPFMVWGQSARAGSIEPDRIIVKVERNTKSQPLVLPFKGTVIDSIPDKGVYLIALPGPTSNNLLTRTLLSSPGIVMAQPNYIYKLPEVNQTTASGIDADSPPYNSGISPASYYNQPTTDIIGTDSALALTRGDNVIVGVIDNGVDFSHPLFTDTITADSLISSFASSGYDYIDGDDDPSEEPGDLYGHGTFVSGIIKLVAPKCKLIPYRAFDEHGVGSCFAVAQSIYNAISDSVDVINMSFCMYFPNPLIDSAIYEAFQAGIVMVASSGNDSSLINSYPAAFEGVIAVSGLDTSQYMATFSNRGDYIDVCAPAVNIYSCFPDSQWGNWTGTSFSAPQVAGICALIVSLRPEITGIEVENLIRLTSEKDLRWGTVVPHDPGFGYGCADAFGTALYLRRGDVDNSGFIDSLDIEYLSNYVNKDGLAPVPFPVLGDVDCSGEINMFDITYLINYIQHGGPPPGCVE